MTLYDMIRDQISANVPFAKHAGITLTELTDGGGSAKLGEQAETQNHIGSQHAGALFTLGETASGAAMAGCFAPILLSVRPVAAKASIKYLKIAKGAIYAKAVTSRSGEDLQAELEAKGHTIFTVDVSLSDQRNRVVAEMVVDWHVSKAA
ncbi:MAG: DUF4442 domain-containing protein [Emcibacter sp.]|nr:DUF4442 domain-containing protein [Emcibacter sp.]